MPLPPRLLPFLCAAASVLFASCERQAAPPAAPVETLKTFPARGLLLEVAPDARRARIAHDEIPGYMEAMTMEFAVRDPASIASAKPGSLLAFRVCVTDREGWIDHIKILGETKLPVTERKATPDPISLPPCRLVDQDGQPYAFGEEQGNVLAISFIFTRCPYPEYCPRLSRAFTAAQNELERTNGRNRWRFLSVTIDPSYDTPARLKDYAATYQANPQRWLFLTGEPAELRKLGRSAGVAIIESGALPEHTLRTLVVDAQGRIAKVYSGNEWRAEELTAEMRRLLTAENSSSALAPRKDQPAADQPAQQQKQ